MASVSRREFIKIGSTAAIGLAGIDTLGCATTERVGLAGKKPNLLFVFGDQWRRHALGFMDEDPVLTPCIDKFAQESMVFTNAISCMPQCAPYRASMMTGRYPLSNGVIFNGVTLRPEEVGIAEVLKTRGYDTGYIGKWHLRGGSPVESQYCPPGPLRHGFDFWYSNECFHQHFNLLYWKNEDPKPLTGMSWSPDHETDVAINYIKTHGKERPFALFLSWSPPHTIHGGPGYDPSSGDRWQYAAPERFEALYRGRELPRRPNVKDNMAEEDLPGYFGAITSLDENFGRLLACLDEQGLAEDTIVVFTADHGEMLGSNKCMGKGVPYEEAINIPFMIRWPGRVKVGREDLLFSSVDVMPSLLGVMRLPVPRNVEGTDFSPAMRGQSVKEPVSALIERFSGVNGHAHGWRGVRTMTHTFVAVSPSGRRLLWDNVNDPYQVNPKEIEQGEDALADDLWKELVRWLERTNDPWLQKSSWAL